MAKKPTKKAPKKLGRTAEEISAELYEVRTKKAELEARNAELTNEFKKALAREQINYAGNYKLDKSATFKVAVPELAIAFATEHNVLKVDTAAAHKVFQLNEALRFEDPTKYGFEIAEIEKINPIKSSSSEE